MRSPRVMQVKKKQSQLSESWGTRELRDLEGEKQPGKETERKLLPRQEETQESKTSQKLPEDSILRKRK